MLQDDLGHLHCEQGQYQGRSAAAADAVIVCKQALSLGRGSVCCVWLGWGKGL